MSVILKNFVSRVIVLGSSAQGSRLTLFHRPGGNTNSKRDKIKALLVTKKLSVLKPVISSLW